MARPARQADCHPERRHQAKGQCAACYGRRLDTAAYDRRYQLKVRYNLTPEEYDRMYLAQGGLCAICESPVVKPHVDHDHDTTVVRALLCRLCNVGIGAFHHSPDRLVRAAEYLDNHNG